MLGAAKNGTKAAAPSGLASMAKMFGIDPAAIMGQAKQLGDAAKQVVEALEKIQARLARIEQHLGIEEVKNGECVSIASGAGTNGR